MNTALGGFAQGMAGGMQTGMQMSNLAKNKKKPDAGNPLANGIGQTPGFELGKPLVVGEMGNGQMAGEQPTTWGTLRGYAGAYGGSRE
ncbi:MAG TPA: hypothetical protein VKY70_00815 [Pseudomonas sp.]|nr:hypothetical protein [Pseudomonas sp.]